MQLPIGEYLHKMNCAFHSKIKSLASRDNRMKKEQARGRYVGPNSQRLLERLKDRGFKQVFDFLDADKVFPYLFCSLSFQSFIIKKEREPMVPIWAVIHIAPCFTLHPNYRSQVLEKT